jgi:hypothetical protein
MGAGAVASLASDGAPSSAAVRGEQLGDHGDAQHHQHRPGDATARAPGLLREDNRRAIAGIGQHANGHAGEQGARSGRRGGAVGGEHLWLQESADRRPVGVGQAKDGHDQDRTQLQGEEQRHDDGVEPDPADPKHDGHAQQDQRGQAGVDVRPDGGQVLACGQGEGAEPDDEGGQLQDQRQEGEEGSAPLLAEGNRPNDEDRRRRGDQRQVMATLAPTLRTGASCCW